VVGKEEVTVLDNADFMLTSSGNVRSRNIDNISSLSCVRATVHDLLLVVGERGWWLPIFFKQNKNMCDSPRSTWAILLYKIFYYIFLVNISWISDES
jgi:hypothetical protein